MIDVIKKIGLYTKGTLYILIGGFTLAGAISVFGGSLDKKGLLDFLENQFLGKFLVLAIAIGCIIYALWRFYSSISDTEDYGNDAGGILKRIGYFLNGLMYGALGFPLLFRQFQSDGDSKQSAVSSLLDLPYGAVVLYVVAVVLLSIGVYQIYKALSTSFLEYLDSMMISRAWVKRIGIAGFIARGVSFVVFAWFVGKAAYENNPSNVESLEGVFDFIASMTLGNYLLILMAVGFIAYGVFQFLLGNTDSKKEK